MKYLVHAILRKERTARLSGLPDWEGRPLEFVGEGKLAAACSLVPTACQNPDVSQLLAHARVVNSLFQWATLLPMRYGCWLDTKQELCHLLSRNEVSFQDCLDQVEGCVEMGIRVLPAAAGSLAALAPGPRPAAVPQERPPAEDAAGQPRNPDSRLGIRYLLARKDCYDEKDGRRESCERMKQRMEQAFGGLFVKSVVDREGAGGPGCWSLYFLIQRQACERFRAAYGKLEEALPDRLLLTGPWPPYNFVTCKTGPLS